jgi:uncharacterized protein
VLEIPPLPDSTILLVEVGSTAHGTGLPGGEDHDEMGVVVEGGGLREELIGTHGYDTKYARHCVRLGFQCIELRTTGELQLPIQGEPADWLRAVRRGEVPFDEWEARWHALDAELERLAAGDSYSSGPDRARIQQWSVATHLRVWRQA